MKEMTGFVFWRRAQPAGFEGNLTAMLAPAQCYDTYDRKWDLWRHATTSNAVEDAGKNHQPSPAMSSDARIGDQDLISDELYNGGIRLSSLISLLSGLAKRH